MSFLSGVAAAAALFLSLAAPGMIPEAHAAEPVRVQPSASSTTPVPATTTPTMAAPTPPASKLIAMPPLPTTAEFRTLADAVAAQDSSVSGETLRCLAGAIWFESKGEPLSGQLAVAQVILNRVKSGRFPTDICGVVTQRGQFSFVRGGHIPAIAAARKTWATAVAVARVAIDKAWDTMAGGALYFNANGRAPGSGIRRIAAIGNHFFYR
jgi:spore germination cell wall hydrolase CwlJ-like protein